MAEPFFSKILIAASVLLFAPSPSWAQEAPRQVRPGVHNFDEITVEHLRPEDLPREGAFRPPPIVDSSVDDLPRMLSVESLRRTRDSVASHTFELIALVQPAPPYRQTPMIYRGHALWVSAKEDQSSPVLISTHDWLEHAQAFYLVPSHVNTPDNGGQSAGSAGNAGQQAAFRSLESVTSGGIDFRWLQAHRNQLIELEISRGDRHRNLSAFRPRDPARLDRPATGLKVFDVRGQLPPQIFGYSPFISQDLAIATFLRSPPSHESLAFYMQTDFQGILGAPIISPHGHLIALGALRNPYRSGVTLAIPPTSIEAFVKAMQALED